MCLCVSFAGVAHHDGGAANPHSVDGARGAERAAAVLMLIEWWLVQRGQGHVHVHVSQELRAPIARGRAMWETNEITKQRNSCNVTAGVQGERGVCVCECVCE